MIPATPLRRAGAVLAVAGAFMSATSAQAAVDKLADDGQRPSVVVSPSDDTAYAAWANPGAGGDPFYCELTKNGGCGQRIRLKGTRPEPFEPPYVFAPQTAGDPVYVVQGRTESTDHLFLWQPKTSGDPIDLGFGSAARDASLGREGLSGNPLLPTVHALGTDSDRPQRGWIHKGFPIGGTAADRAAEGLQLDLNHLANSSITTIADEVSGVDQRPAAVFDNNQDIFYAVGRHPRAFNPVGITFGHWNTAGEWFPTRKLISGRSAQLAKTPAYSVGSTGEFVARMVFADDQGRPAVASFGQNGLLGKPKVLGEYATGAFGSSGDGIQHAIAIGRDSRTYVAWVASNFFGPDSLLLSYSAKAGGTSFSKPVEVATGEDIQNLALAMGQSRGIVAWGKEFSGEDSGNVFSVQLTTAAAATGSSSVVASAKQVPYASKPAVKANGRVGKAGFATVLARNGCVTRGRAYPVRVLVGGERGAKRAKVSRVAVTVAGRTKVDRKGPFSVSLSTRKLRKGRSAGVRVRVLSGRKTARTLRYRLKTCG